MCFGMLYHMDTKLAFVMKKRKSLMLGNTQIEFEKFV